MRRIILLLITAALVLLLAGLVAGGATGSSTTRASFTSGSGANYLRVAVSEHGNLLIFESPQGQDQVGAGEGYAICSGTPGTTSYTNHGWDTRGAESAWGTTTISQPNGAGTFPLTVTRNTSDGKFQLQQVWAKPDATEKDVTVTMTLKNLSSSTINTVQLARIGDFDVGPSSTDRAATNGDSAWQYDGRYDGNEQPATGLQLTALTFATTHYPDILTYSDWAGFYGHDCADISSSAVGQGDWAMRVGYYLGNMAAGQSKTVKFQYGRM